MAQQLNNPQLTVAEPPLIHCARDTRTLKQCSFNVCQRWTLDQQFNKADIGHVYWIIPALYIVLTMRC